MPWTLLGLAAFEKARERGISRETEQAAQLEVLAELASGQRMASGFNAAGLPEAVPLSLWIYAQIGEVDPLASWLQGEVVADFRSNAVAAWAPADQRYRVLYADVMVSPVGVTNEQPGPKLGRPSGKTLCAYHAEEILKNPLPDDAPARGSRGFKKWLAAAVHRRIANAGWSYDPVSVERTLRDLKIG